MATLKKILEMQLLTPPSEGDSIENLSVEMAEWYNARVGRNILVSDVIANHLWNAVVHPEVNIRAKCTTAHSETPWRYFQERICELVHTLRQQRGQRAYQQDAIHELTELTVPRFDPLRHIDLVSLDAQLVTIGRQDDGAIPAVETARKALVDLVAAIQALHPAVVAARERLKAVTMPVREEEPGLRFDIQDPDF